MKITQINGRDKPWRRLKQNEISIFCKLPPQKKNAFILLIFYLLSSSFFFSGFIFYKEALCFIIFMNLENIIEYIRQKLKKHAHFKISSLDEVFTRLFFFLSSRDEISSLSFIPGWVHSGMEFHLGRNV